MTLKDRILIVDDNRVQRRIACACLADDYELETADSGEECLAKLAKFAPDLVLLDVVMPGIGGWKTCERIKSSPYGKFTQVLITSSLASTKNRLKGYSVGADDYLVKPYHCEELLAKVRVQFRLRALQLQVWELNSELAGYSSHLENLVQQRTANFLAMQDAIVISLVELVEKRDTESGEHLLRMQKYSEILAEELSCHGPYQHQIDGVFLENIRRASVLHDIGKVAVPDAILQKPDRLTAEEFELMKLHVTAGAQILEHAAQQSGSDSAFLKMSHDVVRYHHERFDGKGYCDGLSGEDIPLAARIVALADAYDAITSLRCYKAAIAPDAARQIIRQDVGTHFDPSVVEAFERRFDDFVAAPLAIHKPGGNTLLRTFATTATLGPATTARPLQDDNNLVPAVEACDSPGTSLPAIAAELAV